MSSFMWKMTVRNVCRAFKEVNGFECEGDYRPADFGRSLFQSIKMSGKTFQTFRKRFKTFMKISSIIPKPSPYRHL